MIQGIRTNVYSFLVLVAVVGTSAFSADPTPLTKATYLLTGLHCPPCTQTVQRSLAGTKGVRSVTVDWNAKNAKVEFDESILPAQVLAQKIASTSHMMGGNMHYSGWLLLKVPSITDARSGKVAKDILLSSEGISQVALYPEQHSLAVQFSSKGKLSSKDVIKLLSLSGVEASN